LTYLSKSDILTKTTNQNTNIMKYQNGTKLTGGAKLHLPRGLTLEDTEFLTEDGSCGEDEY